MRAPPPNWTSGDWGQLAPSGASQELYFLQLALALSVSQGSNCGKGIISALGKVLEPFRATALMDGSRKTGSLGRGEKQKGSHTRASTMTRGWFPEHTLIAQWPAVRFLPYRAAHRCLAWVLFKVVSKVRDKDIGALCLQAPPKLFASGG